VHPIPPDGLYTDWDYKKPAASAAKYYNAVITAPGGTHRMAPTSTASMTTRAT